MKHTGYENFSDHEIIQKALASDDMLVYELGLRFEARLYYAPKVNGPEQLELDL